MGKGIRIAGSVLGAVTMKPILEQMNRETKLLERQQRKLQDQAIIDVQAERLAEIGPRVWEVRQPFDSIIHEHRLW